MIQETDQFLIDWIKGVTGITARVITPEDTLQGNIISLCLLEATPTLPPRNMSPGVMQIRLTYLITIYHELETEAHRQLGELLFALMEHANLEPIMQPIPFNIWLSLGIKPHPAFRFHTYIQRDRVQPAAKPVRYPLVLNVNPTTDLHGQVLSESNLPIMDAEVECPELGLYGKTNTAGRFHFARVPEKSYTVRLRIRTKNRVIEAIVDKPTTAESPFIIRIDHTGETV